MKKQFFQILAVLIFSSLVFITYLYFSCSKPEPSSSKLKQTNASRSVESSERKGTEYNSGSLGRKEPGHKVEILNGQSTRMDEGTLAKPDANRTIKGLDGLDLSKDSESK